MSFEGLTFEDAMVGDGLTFDAFSNLHTREKLKIAFIHVSRDLWVEFLRATRGCEYNPDAQYALDGVPIKVVEALVPEQGLIPTLWDEVDEV